MQYYLEHFRERASARGLVLPVDLVTDGEMHRCKIEGRSGDTDGAYLLFEDGRGGGFQNHADGLGWEDWQADLASDLTPEEQSTHQNHIAGAKKARKAKEACRRVFAAAKAAKMWEAAKPCTKHPYLTQKRIQSHGVRVLGSNLVIPFYTSSGKLSTVQTIAPAGTKRWLPGGRKQGCFFILGTPGEGPVGVAEGFATAATIHEAAGHAVAIAGDCGNLLPAAKALKVAYPDAELVIYADDDLTPGNPGMTKAQEAAVAVGCRVVSPNWGDDRPVGATDFNDLARARGLDAVRSVSTEDSEPPERPNVTGFQWEANGLCCVSQRRNEDGRVVEVPEWIAPPFTLPGNVRDAESNQWGFLIAWDDLDHYHHEAVIHYEDLAGEGLEFFRTLARGGMILSSDPKLRKKLLQYLTKATMKVKARIRLVETLGWIDDGKAFVLPSGEVIGQAGETLRYAGDQHGGPATKGTLSGWQKGVAAYAVGNPFLTFGVSCAFTGPLLAIIRPDGGGGFNFQGSSSKGKTTTLECASSVWGNPHPLPSWRATSNGIEGLCAARNDGFLPLDEMSQVDPREAGQAAYLISNGRDKARMSKTGEARAPKTWRVLLLSTGEQTLEDKLSEDGKRVRAGQEVRVVDVPCPPQGLFTTAHGFPSMAHLAEHLKTQARSHYGLAAPAFIKRLCEEWEGRAALTSKLKGMESTWLSAVMPDGADGQVRRVASRFALVAVAGELATSMGILPWPQGEASRSASVCFGAWLDRRGHVGASEREGGLCAVLDFLSRHGLSRFAEWNNTDAKPPNMAGVRRPAEPSGWDFFISPAGWKEITKGFNDREVCRAAIEESLLETGKEGTPYQKVRTPHGQGRWYIVRASALGQFREGTA